MWAGPSSSPLRQGLLAATTLEGGKTLGPAEAQGQTHRWLVSDTGCLAGTLGGSQRPHPLSFQLSWLVEQPSGETEMHSPHIRDPGMGKLALTPEPVAFPVSAPKAPHPENAGQMVTPAQGQCGRSQLSPPPHGCSCGQLLSVLSGYFSLRSERLAASGLGGPFTPFGSKRRDWR